jgi:hypothetical protein
MARLNILPDPAFLELRSVLSERLGRVGDRIYPSEFSSMLDPLMREELDHGLREARADEGTVWLLDESRKNLVPGFNSGPRSRDLVGKFKQPLNAGLICMVFAGEQPFLENEVGKNSQQSKLLDTMLGTRTCAMIAVPFYFLQACRGVISCVQLQPPGSTRPEPPGFGPEALAAIQRTSALLTELIEYRLLSQTVGWASD